MATLQGEFPRKLSALRGLLDFLGSTLEEHAVDQASIFWTQLAAEEIFTNMVRHNRSTGNRIALHLEVSADAVTTQLTDYGAEAFDPNSVPAVDPTLTAAERTPGGLGVFIVRSKMDEVDYRHDNGNMTVTMTKYRPIS